MLIYYNTKTGRIKQVVSNPITAEMRKVHLDKANWQPNQKAFESKTEVPLDNLMTGYYIDLGLEIPVPRPEFGFEQQISAKLGDTKKVKSVPKGCIVRIDNAVEFEADGTDLVLNTKMVGTYLFEFEMWPYKTAQVTVTVEDNGN